MKVKEDQNIIHLVSAAKAVCNSINEEQMHEMASTLPEENQIEFAAAMTDLAMAVQLHEALNDD